MLVKTLLPSLCVIVNIAMAADAPFVGKWKVNLAKSDFGQATFTFEALPSGEWQSTGFGVSYKFKMDGKDYPDNMGGTNSWKAVDSHTWEITGKANGRVTETDKVKLSSDGKTLTIESKQMKPNGGSIDSTSVYERASGESSLSGKWKTQKVSGSSGTMELIASGANGLTFKDPDMGMTCAGKLDGKDYPCTGPMLPPGFTAATKSVGGSLDLIVKKDGKPFIRATYTVAPDGKSMIEEGTPVTGEKFKVFFDRI